MPSQYSSNQAGQSRGDGKSLVGLSLEQSNSYQNTISGGPGQTNGSQNSSYLPPTINPPKGGGSLRSIDEKFQVNPATGTASLSVAIPISTARSNMMPNLALNYDSGSGNSPFGLGWSLSLPSISRRTSKGVPRYKVGELEEECEDVFLLSGVEDLVPKLVPATNHQHDFVFIERTSEDGEFLIRQYAPRTEALFFRIERWSHKTDLTSVHWRTISKFNVTSIYGLSSNTRISDPFDCSRIFKWLVALEYDAKGNAILYNYKSDDRIGINIDLVSEAYRSTKARTTNRYIKSILYGNKISNIDQHGIVKFPDINEQDGKFVTQRKNWMFEVVFDYGDHNKDPPLSESDGNWTARKDAFSSYKSGFELRTTRLCARVLMFHHMKEELGVNDCLISSTELSYNESPTASYLAKITQAGFSLETTQHLSQIVPTNYLKKEYPPIEFEYSQFTIFNGGENVEIRQISKESMENLPVGISGSYNWLDFDGEGKPSVVYANQDRWYVKRNLSNFLSRYNCPTPSNSVPSSPNLSSPSTSPSGSVTDLHLGVSEVIAPIPNLTLQSTFSFLDLDGNGSTDLLISGSNDIGTAPGFWQRTQDGCWTEFNTFPHYPSGLNLQSPKVRLMDLTGDGRADIISSEGEDSFSWYPGLGTSGYAEAKRTYVACFPARIPNIDEIPPDSNIGMQVNRDPIDGPLGNMFLSDSEQTYLADFTGDGLTDLVRIKNGDISYWPNIGYGHFGPRVRMENSPWMDTLDNFSYSRLILGDIDGSGCADLLYFPPNGGLKLWINEAGNAFCSQPIVVPFPQIDDLSSLKLVDIFGNGTSNLFWSSSSPGRTETMRFSYAEFNHGLKPHLLKRFKKGSLETRLEYKPSSQFYQDDKLKGTPWATKLQFPVQCLSSVGIFDYVSGNYNLSEYRYHHGFYDGTENEFRGFGMVQTVEKEYFFGTKQKASSLSFPGKKESFTGVFSTPTVLSKKWYHTGAYLEANKVTEAFSKTYYSDDALAKLGEPLSLQPPIIDSTMTSDESRQAWRSVKGVCLREEIYQLDGSPDEVVPFSINDYGYITKFLQRSSTKSTMNRRGIFRVSAKGHLSIQLERKTTDHRVTHNIVLESDNFGNVTKSVDVKYGRVETAMTTRHSAEDIAMQSTTVVLYAEHHFTNPIDTATTHLAPLPASSKEFQVYGIWPQGQNLFSESDFGVVSPEGFMLRNLPSKDYTDNTSTTGLRLVGASRILYRSDDLSQTLPQGTVETMAIKAQSYTLALTPDILSCYKSNQDITLLQDFSVLTQQGSNSGGYVDLENNNHFWVPSGAQSFSKNSMASPADELATARASFFTPVLFTDPFQQNHTVIYDYNFLLPTKIVDALGNTTSASYNYARMQPQLLTDANGNQHAFAYDGLGNCVYRAVMGKPSTNPTGDCLDTSILSRANEASKVQELLADPISGASSFLGNSTSCTLSGFPAKGNDGSWSPGFQISIARDTHVNATDPGQVSNPQLNVSYFDGTGRKIQTKQYVEADIEGNEWVGQYTVLTHKGTALKEFLSLYTTSHVFSRPEGGIPAAIKFYDALGRRVATLNPNMTWCKTVYGPWNSVVWDEGDTIELDPLEDNDTRQYFPPLLRIRPSSPSWISAMRSSKDALAQKAAAQSLLCSKTPIEIGLDIFGNEYCKTLDNGNNEKFSTRKFFNIQKHQKKVADSMDRIVSIFDYDMRGNVIHSSSMETGQKWFLNNISGHKIFCWDSRGTRERRTYDPLRRLSKTHIQVGAENEYLSEQTIYGEEQPEPEERNLRGKIYQKNDQALKTTNVEYDYAGNATTSRRQFLKEYKVAVNWAGATPVEMEGNIFESKASFDALQRLVSITRSDGSSSRNVYNRQGLLLAVHGSINSPQVQETGFVTEIKYNANNQQTSIAYSNGSKCEMFYDPLTLLIKSKTTTRADGSLLQNLQYTRDCLGNLTYIEDASQQALFFRGNILKPTQSFTYDALGRLISATGREHLGQRGQSNACLPSSCVLGVSRMESPADAKTMATYTETYMYDSESNILSMAHSLSDASNTGWTRAYKYEEPSLLEPWKKSNRLTSTSIGEVHAKYRYDGAAGANGLMSGMTGMNVLQWDASNQLSVTSSQRINTNSSQTPEMTYYRYDSFGNRVRKVTERSADTASIPTKLKDHRYIEPGCDTFIKFNRDGTTPKNTIHRAHFFALDSPIASVETSTSPSCSSDPLIRYMLSDQNCSITLNLDDKAEIISQQEYSPYGNIMLEASHGNVPKRYRYSGKELDKSTGLYYYGKRYLMPWLGRWISPDPAGILDGCNVWCFCGGNPVGRRDRDGLMFQNAGPAPPPPQPQPLRANNLMNFHFSWWSTAQIYLWANLVPQVLGPQPWRWPLNPLPESPFADLGELVELYRSMRSMNRAVRFQIEQHGAGINIALEGIVNRYSARDFIQYRDAAQYLADKIYHGTPEGGVGATQTYNTLRGRLNVFVTQLRENTTFYQEVYDLRTQVHNVLAWELGAALNYY